MDIPEKKRTRAITGWRQVQRRPGILRGRLPAPPPKAALPEPVHAAADLAANERWEDEGGAART